MMSGFTTPDEVAIFDALVAELTARVNAKLHERGISGAFAESDMDVRSPESLVDPEGVFSVEVTAVVREAVTDLLRASAKGTTSPLVPAIAAFSTFSSPSSHDVKSKQTITEEELASLTVGKDYRASDELLQSIEYAKPRWEPKAEPGLFLLGVVTGAAVALAGALTGGVIAQGGEVEGGGLRIKVGK